MPIPGSPPTRIHRYTREPQPLRSVGSADPAARALNRPELPSLGATAGRCPPTPRLTEQHGGDRRARQAATADDHEGGARGSGIHYWTPEEVADGCGDTHPAVDVGEDPAKQLGWRVALKVRRHVTVRQRDRETTEQLGGEGGHQPGCGRGQQVTGSHDGEPGHDSPGYPQPPASRTDERQAGQQARRRRREQHADRDRAGPKVTVARKGRMRSSGAEKNTTTQNPTATARTYGVRRTNASPSRASRTNEGRTGPRCPASAPAAEPAGSRRGTSERPGRARAGFRIRRTAIRPVAAQHRPQFPYRASQRVGLDEIIVSHHSGDAPADRCGQRRIDQGQDEDHREQSSQRRQQQRQEPGQDRLDQPADGEQAARAEPVRDHARQRRGQRRDRLREQQQPDRCRAARCSLHVQDQGSRRHRVAERADGRAVSSPANPGDRRSSPSPATTPLWHPVKRSEQYVILPVTSTTTNCVQSLQ